MRKYLLLGIVVVVVAIGATVGVLVTGTTAQTANRFVATLAGTNEVPSVNTTAAGEAVFVLSDDGMSMTYTVTVSNIDDVFASHIHLAMAGVNGPVVVPLFSGSKIGTFTGVLAEGTITAATLSGSMAGKPLSALITEIKAGNAYVNVHTKLHASGEIRGQIKLATP